MIKDEDIDPVCPCPCYKRRCTDCPAGFEKLMDFKNAGLVIYRRITKPANNNQKNKLGLEADTSGFIFHNTKNEALVSKECLKEMMGKKSTECKRCRQLMRHAVNLLQIVSAISKNNIIGVCDHCKLSDHPCFDCEEALNKFFEAKKNAITKEKVREWLKNVESELKEYFANEKETKKESLLDHTEKYEHNNKIRPRARSEICIERLRQRGDERDERKLEISELCRESIEQDLATPPPALTDANKKQIISNFIDHLDELYSTLTKSSTRKLKSALPKKQTADYREDDFTRSSHTFRHKQVIEKQSLYEPIDELPKTGFVFSFPRDEKKRKEEKCQELKSSSELISDIHDRIEQKNEEIRFKKLEEQEIKQRAQEEKNKLLEEKKRLTEAKALLEKKGLELSKETRPLIDKSKDASSSATTKENIQSESEVNLKEMRSKSKSRVSKSEQLNETKIKEKETKSASKLTSKPDTSRVAKTGVASSKIEQKKTKGEPEDVSKQKTTSKYSDKESEGVKQHKDEMKSKEKESKEATLQTTANLKQRDSGPSGDAKGQKSPKPGDESTRSGIKETKADQGKGDKDGKATKTSKDAEVAPKETKTDQGKGGKVGKVNKTEIDAEVQKKEKVEKEKGDIPKTEKYEEETKKEKGSKKLDVTTITMEGDKEKKTDVNLTAGTKKEKGDDNGEKKEKRDDKREKKEAKKQAKDDKPKVPEESRVPRRQLEAQQAQAAAAKEGAKEKKARSKSPETEAKKIKMLNQSQNYMVLDLVKMKPPKISLSQIVSPSQMHTHETRHHVTDGINCPLCKNSNLALEYESRKKTIQEQEEMIKGRGIRLRKASKEKEDIVIKPALFQINYDDNFKGKYTEPLKHIPIVREHTRPLIEKKSAPTMPEEESKGVIHYALSDRTFIEKGWTKLPTEKVVRKMNVYRMRPAHPEFDWFQKNKKKGQLTYDTGERLAEFDDDGHGRWFYRNQRLALQYYDAEEINAQQRFVIYSNGEPDERGRTRPYTVLATFDYLGNGIVFDHSGKIRMKYNQTEGVVLDRNIGPATHWKWHTLNDPPVLQQVMIDTHMSHKDPTIIKMATPHDKEPRPDNEEMLAIEFDNFIKEKSKKLKQKFKPFQIKMKAMKINENFSLKVLDQAHVYLIYRDGTANIKVNLGMLLDHKEIVDTDTAEVGEVANNMERLPPRTDSMAAMQRSVAFAQQFERNRTERERRIRPTAPVASADKLASAVCRPVRLPLRSCSTITPTSYTKSRKPTSCNVYYDNRLF